eukprot:7810-Heterococcus_DN1.PRE.4
MLSLLEASPGPEINSTLDRSPPSLSFAAFSNANAKPGLISPLYFVVVMNTKHKAATKQQADAQRVVMHNGCTIDSILHSVASNIYLRTHEAAAAELCTMMHNVAL